MKVTFLLCSFGLLLLGSCRVPESPAQPTAMLTTATIRVAATEPLPATAAPASQTPNPSPRLSASPEASATQTRTTIPTVVTATSPPSPTHSPTTLPTYAILRGEVTVEHAVCHYGPGKPYLYKYGLVGGSNLEIIRRLDPPTFLEVRAIGGDNPCWVNAEYMDVRGDVLSVQPVDPRNVVLPASGTYAPPSGVSASRSGSTVTVSWAPIALKAGDDSEQYPYLVEAWVCQSGRIVFIPTGSYQNSVQITDEAGCTESSYARLFGVEKHGYTNWIEVPWPQVTDPTATP